MIGLIVFFGVATAAAAGYTALHRFSYRRAFEDTLSRIEGGSGYANARPLGGLLVPGFLLLGALLYPPRLLFRVLRWII